MIGPGGMAELDPVVCEYTKLPQVPAAMLEALQTCASWALLLKETLACLGILPEMNTVERNITDSERDAIAASILDIGAISNFI